MWKYFSIGSRSRTRSFILSVLQMTQTFAWSWPFIYIKQFVCSIPKYKQKWVPRHTDIANCWCCSMSPSTVPWHFITQQIMKFVPLSINEGWNKGYHLRDTLESKKLQGLHCKAHVAASTNVFTNCTNAGRTVQQLKDNIQRQAFFTHFLVLTGLRYGSHDWTFYAIIDFSCYLAPVD